MQLNSFCPAFTRLSVPSWHGDFNAIRRKKKKKESVFNKLIIKRKLNEK